MKLQEFGPNIWVADGPRVHVVGPVTLPTRTIVVRLSDGSLWLNSPIEAPAREMDDVAQLGPVRYLVSPTPLHDWRLGPWKKHFPEAALCGITRNRRKSARYDIDLAAGTHAAWSDDLEWVVFRGNAFLDEVEFFHRPSRTLVFTDFIQNQARRPGALFHNAVARIAGVLDGGVPTDIRATFVRRDLAREAVGRILAWDFERIILAHGPNIDRDAKKMFREAFEWLA